VNSLAIQNVLDIISSVSGGLTGENRL